MRRAELAGRTLPLWLHVAVVWLCGQVAAREHSYCGNCDLYDMLNRHHHHHHHRDLMLSDEPEAGSCTNPCQCTLNEPPCKKGVSTIKDGCDCCYMCARQQGDLCTHKHKCDEKKKLYCDRKSEDGRQQDTGFCRSRSAKTCKVDGVVYKDGETFNKSCREVCTCQNGQYGCSDLWSHEDIRPSRENCPHAKLVQIKGRCCKEWMCPNDAAEIRGFATSKGQCKVVESAWSACSVSCDMGVSIRISNNNSACQPRQEKRLCLIRPCQVKKDQGVGQACRSIWRAPSKIKLRYRGCVSVKEYLPRYCSTCLTDKCCVPKDTKNRNIAFECKKEEKTKYYNVLWIQSCHCLDRCP